MIYQIWSHIITWANKKISLVGCMMVANQVVLTSIWYLPSCDNYIDDTFKRDRAFVWNIIWSMLHDKCALGLIYPPTLT
jgi:hypothetical protein